MASPIQTSFNAGELAPEVSGRVDIGKYQSGCTRMENFIPLVQGPARRRGGTRYVAEVKDSSAQTWLATFIFNATQAYVLEFGDQYVRFYTDDGVLESSPGTPLEVATPWTAAQLTNDEGGFALSIAQSGDVLYICHPLWRPRKLARTGATTWVLSAFDGEQEPFEDFDHTQTTTLYASARTGSVTIIASAATFTSDDVGRRVYLEQKKANDIRPWEPDRGITSGHLRRYGGRTYKALNSDDTGTVPPTHTTGAEYDGQGTGVGVQWEFQDPGYGWAAITAYNSATSVDATVISDLPENAVGSGNATTRWALGEWCEENGYPSHVCFFRNRLCFARASDRKLWFSVSGDYENFNEKDEGGSVTPDMAISLTIEADQSANAIRYVVPGEKLIIGTASAEFVCGEATDSDPFGPSNYKIARSSTHGSRDVAPVKVDGSLVFVTRSGRKLRELSFNALQDGYGTTDLSVLAPHLLPYGTYVTQMAFQREPYSVIWCVRSDGLLLGCTFDRTQYAEPPYGGWHRHPLGGDGIVESVVCIPSPNNERDDLWMIVRRTIDGSSVRYVERMSWEYESRYYAAFVSYLDCSLGYSGAPATTISGLDHLEGETVGVLADGAVHPDRTVSAGSITLASAAQLVQVGYHAPCKLATMRIPTGTKAGTGQGKTKRLHKVTFRIMDTLGGYAGPAEDVLDEILFRTAGGDMDSAPSLVELDDVDVPWPAGYEKEGIVWYVNEDPLPATIVAIMPALEVYD